ncbi:DUF1236 domain-containing protein [Sinorhizobium terangae]|uniref:DUF1236 domain-containing protein n=1 Tax=Sinorhizobium terangae TaxID=110322 RepID=A0A6N7LMH3_SINTE|nr:DUF1236 domain-containing protein [Sinorhizobium terangae]MBB4189358.1 hypothetical protein [Sinorhizobium terangae]MQX18961.1 DUF1236 domain-containing protein [Sinorhizobium terangae]MQX19032.1 DUF1236 domain-containing protein [Sinorhizobium terangae]WFU49585.1 DUF1236 domain-containing protein [Sinorhizobium terangae]
MRKLILIAAAAALLGGPAIAQNSNNGNRGTAAGIAGGAATGAIIGGPVGAGVGAVVGGALGGALAPPPPRVITQVQQMPAPPSVVIRKRIAVGQPLPETVALTPIPDAPEYSVAVVNDQRVIVEPRSRTVVQIVR